MQSTLADELATGMLAHSGLHVIWDLHVAAAAAKGQSKLEMAAALTELAEAAERLWIARNVHPEAR